jgi:hypothetical protein
LALILAHKAFVRLPHPPAALYLDKALIHSPHGATVLATGRILKSGGVPQSLPAAKSLPVFQVRPSSVWPWTVHPGPYFFDQSGKALTSGLSCMTIRGPRTNRGL